jgi:hypothetical protein
VLIYTELSVVCEAQGFSSLVGFTIASNVNVLAIWNDLPQVTTLFDPSHASNVYLKVDS